MDADPSPPPVIGYATADADRRPRRAALGVLCVVVAVGSLLISGLFTAVWTAEASRMAVAWTGARRVAASRRALTPAEIALGLGRLPVGVCNDAQVRTLRQLLATSDQQLIAPDNVRAGRVQGLQVMGMPGRGATSVTFWHDETNREVSMDAAGRVQRIDTVSWATGERSRTTFAADGTRVDTAGRYTRASTPVVVAAAAATAAACAANGLLAVLLGVVGVLLVRGHRYGPAGLRRYARWKLPAAGAFIVALTCMWAAGSVGPSVVDLKLILLLMPGALGCLWAGGLLRLVGGAAGAGRAVT